MMDFDLLYQKIESDDFAVKIGIGSGTKSMVALLDADELIGEISKNGDRKVVEKSVCDRILRLVQYRLDLRYQNPFDFALAAYLWILKKIESDTTLTMAEQIFGAPNVWLSKKIASSFLFEPNVAIENDLLAQYQVGEKLNAKTQAFGQYIPISLASAHAAPFTLLHNSGLRVFTGGSDGDVYKSMVASRDEGDGVFVLAGNN